MDYHGVMRFWLFYIKKYFFICGYDKIAININPYAALARKYLRGTYFRM